MVRQTNPRKPVGTPVVGRGKVTPIQVAFIVDQYLADNNFTGTRSLFRSEAASLLSRTNVQQAPKSLLSLGEMLHDYICLKEQKLMVDQAKSNLHQENARVQTLLHGMQDLLFAYNSSGSSNCITPPPNPSAVCSLGPSMVSNSLASSPSGYTTGFNTPLISSVSVPDQSRTIVPAKVTNPVLNSDLTRKRKGYKAATDIPAKKICGLPPSNQLTQPGTSTRQLQNNVASLQGIIRQSSGCKSIPSDGSPVQGSTVAKNLFNKSSSQSPHSNSSGPKTPQRSISSHTDKSVSPPEEIMSTAKSNVAGTSLETTPTNCTIISSQTIIVSSPAKNFSVERKLCTYYSPSKSSMTTQGKRDHVKGRLNFDNSDLPVISENASFDTCTTSESDMDMDLFDFDMDTLGPDFSLSELLSEFDMECGETGFSCQEALGTSADPLCGSVSQPNEANFRAGQELIRQELTSKDSITSMRSITKRVQLSSPAKTARHSDENQEKESTKI